MPSFAAYRNFDLLITRAGDRYRALVVDAPGGDADIFFDLPPSLPGFQELLALTGPRRGLRDTPTQTTPAASLDDVGRLLYEAIFQREVRDVLVASQREAADNQTLGYACVCASTRTPPSWPRCPGRSSTTPGRNVFSPCPRTCPSCAT